MDGSAFDRLTRSLSAVASRRRLLRLVTDWPLGAFLALVSDETTSAARRRQAHRRHPQPKRHDRAAATRRQRERRQLGSEACIPTGQRCPSTKPRGKGKKLGCHRCCQDYTVTAAGGRRFCACRPRGTPCGRNGASACCSGVCANGICQGSAPSPPTPGCVNHRDCGGNAICLPNGSCQTCTVTCPGTTCDGAALQEALHTGGTVYVCPGRYIGTFRVDDGLARALTVIGAGEGADPGANTILDAGHSGSALTIFVGVKPTVTLERLRITGGALTIGAGILHEGTELIMTDCTVTGNTLADGFGGGILSGNHATLQMTRCTVSNNQVTGANWYAGGIYTDGTTTLTDCLVTGNHATNSNSSGGGLFLFGGQTTLNGHTAVRDNDALFGGGIYVSLGTLVINASCQVTANTATGGPGNGGGIYNAGGTVVLDGADSSPIVVDNCHENCVGSVPKCATTPVSC